jgi:Fur family ferric uptake transcriptional regulator
VSAGAHRSSWSEQAARVLSEAGHRRGAARGAILKLLEEQWCALSVSEIRRRLREDGHAVSRASVYRVIDELEALGVLQRVEVGSGTVRYEPVRTEPEHHHHLVCDRCGRLEPFTDAGLERAIRRLSRRLPRSVSEHEIVIHGECEVCAAA